eukprot:TRINITY_DN20167_c0_g1_i3.p1 TRINITY_DN20167_c0_g1~~TRINITY_DN20167_c0_g1_i3.p1  ORF type:complete len:115 (-),score=13.55 TRINITY_DN20167_c0_g1_i3:1648-1992(-)
MADLFRSPSKIHYLLLLLLLLSGFLSPLKRFFFFLLLFFFFYSHFLAISSYGSEMNGDAILFPFHCFRSEIFKHQFVIDLPAPSLFILYLSFFFSADKIRMLVLEIGFNPQFRR